MDGQYGKRLKTNDYPKDSFDRFGDDLSEVIFGYMRFEDKVRLEYVAKQWRRLVYNKQFVVEFYRNAMTHKSGDEVRVRSDEQIVLILKKCPNIKKVIIGDIDGNELSLIGEHCPRLKTLAIHSTHNKYLALRHGLEMNSYCLSNSHLSDFCVKYGHRLESFGGIFLYRYIRQKFNLDVIKFLEHCTNLKNISANSSSFNPVFIRGEKQFLPKLKFIDNLIGIYNTNDEIKLKILSDKYSQSLKSIKVSFNRVTTSQVKTCIDYICRFESLQSLELQFHLKIKLSMDESIEQLTEKLSQLKNLSLTISNRCFISDRSLISLSELKSLVRLKIFCRTKKAINPRNLLSKECSQLRHLEIIHPVLGEDFLDNIHSVMPKLQTLSVITENVMKDSSIESLQTMKYIKSVVIQRQTNDAIDITEKVWYFGKRLNEVMSERNDVNRLSENFISKIN